MNSICSIFFKLLFSLHSLCVYGGGDRRQQIGAVAKGVEIVVATPGRLYDLMQAGALKTSSVSYVVLDEADRMLDLGFEPQIKKILIDVRPDRQIIMTRLKFSLFISIYVFVIIIIDQHIYMQCNVA